MDVDVAAEILAGSILSGLAFIVMCITVVVINNIFSKYWKPIKWMRMLEHPMYISREELHENGKEETSQKV